MCGCCCSCTEETCCRNDGDGGACAEIGKREPAVPSIDDPCFDHVFDEDGTKRERAPRKKDDLSGRLPPEETEYVER